MTERGTRRAVLVGIVLGLCVLSAAVGLASADCDCPQSGECSYMTCCYVPGTCFPTGANSANICLASWHEPSQAYQCGLGAECSYCEEPCDGSL